MVRTSLVVRSLFLLGFVIAMPLLAVPGVARWADEYLYGDGDAGAQPPPAEVDEDAAEHDRQVVRAVLETPLADSVSPKTGKADGHGLDAATAQPPVMPPSPEFPASRPDVPPTGPSRATSDRLAEIRQRLEDLGADYIRIEADSQTGLYHCHCRMLVAPGATQTRTFQASGNDPTAVAEQLLRTVEWWRTSLSTGSPVQ